MRWLKRVTKINMLAVDRHNTLSYLMFLNQLYDPKILVAYSAAAITHGFEQSFSELKNR